MLPLVTATGSANYQAGEVKKDGSVSAGTREGKGHGKNATQPKSEAEYEITYEKADGSGEVHEADEQWVPRAIKDSERVQGKFKLPPFGSALLNIDPDNPAFEASGHATWTNKRTVNGTTLIVYIKKAAEGESEAAAEPEE